ncbi:DUF1000-domain-containing protein [Ramicandelaber brevisporus]|nr:DUF1000-domain-containing protein [Ramicandelaber brevisporus]
MPCSCGSSADHVHDHLEVPVLRDFLLPIVDLDHIRCLNEQTPNSARAVFKPWHLRYDPDPILESDADEQLLIHIPLTASVKLKSIFIRCHPDAGAQINELKAFVNQPGLDFGDAENATPAQMWQLGRHFNVSGNDMMELPVARSNFNGVNHLTLFVVSNHGDDTTKIQFLGLSGDWSPLIHKAPQAVYEARANLKDHKTKNDDQLAKYIY